MAIAKYAARFKHENIMFLALSPGVVNTSTEMRKSFIFTHIETSYSLCMCIQPTLPP